MTFKTRLRCKNYWALIEYDNGALWSVPVYAEGSYLLVSPPKDGMITDIEIQRPLGSPVEVTGLYGMQLLASDHIRIHLSTLREEKRRRC